MIPDEAKRSMQGAIPAVIATCHPDGTPNASFVSQVWYVDPEHVALSFQFFNKTAKNIAENPVAEVLTTDPVDLKRWRIGLEFERRETEGDLFDEMDMSLEAIASMTGMSGVFQLKSADIYRVRFVERYSMLNNSGPQT